MDKRLDALKLLSSTSGKWKIGMPDSCIAKITKQISYLPAGVFDGFFIDQEEEKKISTVDFALMTYDMSENARMDLMNLYGIHPATVNAIFHVADEIANVIEKENDEIEM